MLLEVDISVKIAILHVCGSSAPGRMSNRYGFFFLLAYAFSASVACTCPEEMWRRPRLEAIKDDWMLRIKKRFECTSEDGFKTPGLMNYRDCDSVTEDLVSTSRVGACI